MRLARDLVIDDHIGDRKASFILAAFLIRSRKRLNLSCGYSECSNSGQIRTANGFVLEILQTAILRRTRRGGGLGGVVLSSY